MIIVRHEYPSFERFDTCLYILVDLVFTEVFYLNTATVVIRKDITFAGIIAKSCLAHFGQIISGDKTGSGATPCLVDILVFVDFRSGTNIVKHSNGIDHSLEVIGIAASVVTADSEGVSIFGCLGHGYAGRISGSLQSSVNVKADTRPTGSNHNSIVIYSAHSYINLGLIEGSGPFSSAVVLTADNDLAVIC